MRCLIHQRRTIAFALWVAASLWTLPVPAAPEPEADPIGDPAEDGYLSYLNAPHAWFSRRLGDLSRQIDSYFGSSDVYDEVSGSYAELALAQQFAEAGDSQAGADVRVKIDLPRTERRFKLLLESVSEEIDPRDNDPDRVRGEAGDAPSSGVFAGLRRVLVDTTGLRLSTDIGVKLRTPPDPFARARLRRTWPLGAWQLRFKETLFWFRTDGAGQVTEFDLDRRLNKQFALRASARYDWLDETDEWRLRHGLTLYQILDKRNSLAYEADVEASNRPLLRSERYRLGVRFRRRVHEEWLFLSLVPDVVWRRERNFRPEPGLLIELQMLFGESYLGS